MIVYTSGTTGRPKGVVTTHANLTAQIESLVTAWEWTVADRTLLVLPLHHVHGILNVVCCALWSGATLEMLPKFDSEATWDRLASGELTVFSAVPTIYHRLIRSWEAASPDVQHARSRGCRALRLMMSGLCRPSAHDARSLERDHRPRAARALRHDGSRHGAVEPASRRAPPGLCRPAAARRVGAARRRRAAAQGPGRVLRILAAARQHAGSVRRWMVPHRRCRRHRRRRVSAARTIERRHPQERRRTRSPRSKSKKCCARIPRLPNASSSAWRMWNGGSASAARRSCGPAITLELDELKEWAQAAPGALTRFPERSRLRRAASQKCHGQSRQT